LSASADFCIAMYLYGTETKSVAISASAETYQIQWRC
jgi:hypothetical protein